MFEREKFDAIVHFAASIEVFESMQNPLKYYMNNTVNTTNLIETCLQTGVNKLYFLQRQPLMANHKLPL